MAGDISRTSSAIEIKGGEWLEGNGIRDGEMAWKVEVTSSRDDEGGGNIEPKRLKVGNGRSTLNLITHRELSKRFDTPGGRGGRGS